MKYVAPGTALRAILRSPEIVIRTWRAARRTGDNITEAEVRDALEQLGPLWDELFPAEQARIVQLLIDRLDVHEDGIDIRFRSMGSRVWWKISRVNGRQHERRRQAE
jgi:hypothetical protein